MCCGQFQSKATTVTTTGLLDDRPVPGHDQLGDEVGVVPCVESACASEDLQPELVRVVHEEQRDPLIAGDVAGAQVLTVAAEVGPGQVCSSGLRTNPGGPPRNWT